MSLEFEIGLGLMLVGCVLALRVLWRFRGGMSVLAKVIRVDVVEDAKSAGKSGRLYKPTVRFIDTRGVVRFITDGAAPVERRVGDELTVRYRPDDPQKAFVEDKGAWVAPIVVCAAGAALAVMGLYN
jgi:type IV secretory pathway TrbF-like protein